MCTVEIGFYDLFSKINTHTFFFFFEEMGALDNLPSPEETNQS